MSKFTVEIDTNNASFQPEPDLEVARLLRQVSVRVENGETSGKMRDGNGNTCGRFKFNG